MNDSKNTQPPRQTTSAKTRTQSAPAPKKTGASSSVSARASAVKPTAAARPSAAKPSEQPAKSAAARPSASAKSAPAAKPAANARPASATKPATAARPASATKPAAAVKSAATAKSAAAAKPSAPSSRVAAAKSPAASSGGGKSAVDVAARVAPKATARHTAAATAKPASGKSAPKPSDKPGFVQSVMQSKPKRIAALVMIGILLAGLIAMCIALPVSCNAPSKTVFENPRPVQSTVGYSAEYLGTVPRSTPTEVKNEGLETGYPKYGYTLNMTTEQKNAMIAESAYLCTRSTSHNSGAAPEESRYDKMDANGYLYKTDGTPSYEKGTQIQRKLYKHSGAVGLYLGDVADDEPAVVKKITMRKRGYSGYGVTGLYAPAGEVVKVEMSETDMERTGGIVIHIGQALYNGQANNIWSAKGINRMPVILNTLIVDKNTSVFDESRKIYTAYIGSFVGGPIYIRNEDTLMFSVTVSGAVRYSHFILGYTTEEDFAENAKSSAPYFDLEVWENGVLHSGPKRYAQSFSYADLEKAAVLWDKIALTSTRVATQGIVFLFDTFVAAGAAVAFPGRRSVNCPMDWMSGALNYKTFVNGGAWGNMHEYHHNFQGGWGRGNGGEVTNNALTLVNYSLFTRISANRKLGAGSDGLGGWNSYTNAPWALRAAMKKTDNPLREYAVLLHSFGQENFLSSITKQQRTGAYNQTYYGWYGAFTEIVENDLTYLFNGIYGAGLTEAQIDSVKRTDENGNDYPMYVPVSSIFQTGSSYMRRGVKEYSQTMQPYVIPFGADLTVDLSKYKTNAVGMYESGSIVIPDGFTYKIKNVTQPEHGELVGGENGVYVYKPDKNHLRSGKVYVTLEITKDDGAFEVPDTDLVLEFEQSHEMNKTMLERTIYSYDAETMPESARAAFESGYAGHSSKVTEDNVNRSQNSNTDLWVDDRAQGDWVCEAVTNKVVEIKGKMYIDEAGKYRIAIRGRWDVALYTSVNGEDNYELAASKTQTNNDYGFHMNEGWYKDFENLQAEDWVYFKAVLRGDKHGGTHSFMGVGWGKFTAAGGVMDDENSNEASGVTEETIEVRYASAYRSDYEFPDGEFETEYFNKKDYFVSYADSKVSDATQTCVRAENYTPWDKTEKYKIENMFDGNTETYIHNGKYDITSSKPFVVEAKMSAPVRANRISIFAPTNNANAKAYLPKTFRVWVGSDGVNWTKAADVEASTLGNLRVDADFDNYYTFEYYKLEVTDTHSTSYNKYISISKVEFSDILSLPRGRLLSPSYDMFTVKGDWTLTPAFSWFGHVFVGKRNANIEFEFDGTRLGIISNIVAGTDYEVKIDGKKVESIEVKDDENPMYVGWLSPELKEGHHKVRIKCLKKNTGIDSLLIW
ncbi:MAG: hypothetical protein HFE48_02470 [Clostridia bacterium]|nr:hypothetical protein [Clostridia bacterium]